MKKYLYELTIDHRNNWYDQCVKFLLLGLSLIYKYVVQFIEYLYHKGFLKKRTLPKPVICVGNIVAGGTGKTPLVIYLVEYLLQQGLNPAILTRGYMSQNKMQSDEVMMMKQLLPNVPIYQNKNRYEAGMMALKERDIDIFIMDDGFQHWRLNRNMDIVLVDGRKPFANGYVLPRGLLREPANALSRADIVCYVGSLPSESLDAKQWCLIDIIPYRLIDGVNQEEINLDFLSGKTVVGFCGIGNPKKFWHTLKNLQCNIVEKKEFLDHHPYDQKDINCLLKIAKVNNVNLIVTTRKDAVKLVSFLDTMHDIRLLIVDVRVEILKGKKVLLSELNEKVGL